VDETLAYPAANSANRVPSVGKAMPGECEHGDWQ
jgi:hypothetical protein